MRHFTLVSPEGGDWEALYMDGTLVAEGHSLNVTNVLDAIADVFSHTLVQEEISDDLAEMGFSENLSDMIES